MSTFHRHEPPVDHADADHDHGPCTDHAHWAVGTHGAPVEVDAHLWFGYFREALRAIAAGIPNPRDHAQRALDACDQDPAGRKCRVLLAATVGQREVMCDRPSGHEGPHREAS